MVRNLAQGPAAARRVSRSTSAEKALGSESQARLCVFTAPLTCCVALVY